jgi:hypothetical protein
MKIPLKQAFDIISNASAVIINDDTLIYPILDELQDSDENQFLFLSWDYNGCPYNLKFCEGDNQEVEVIGASMFLYDTDANDDSDVTQITILIPQNLEVDKV